jgi:hydroxymethylbilane synthase
VSPEVRIGTRGSLLALAQARLVAEALVSRGVASRMVVIETDGDRRAPDTAWGEGAFVAAIEQALLDDRVDVAVHSAKDLPTDEDPRLRVAAFLPREDPRDALVLPASAPAATVASLAPGALVGTDSPRRAGFLRAARPDLRIVPVHGNVDTRLRRLDAGEVDALVLAVAGLVRLGHAGRISERIAEALVPPAPGQGAIAVQVRVVDASLSRRVGLVDHAPTRLAVEAERAFLRATGGGCRAPVGALAELDASGGRLELRAGVAREDGGAAVFDATACLPAGSATAAAELAARLAVRISGAVLAPLASSRGRVLVTRPADQAGSLVADLAALGLESVVVPAIAIEAMPPGGSLDRAVSTAGGARWVVVTSPNGARAALAAAGRLGVDASAVRWAAVGDATARVLEAAGAGSVWRPPAARGLAVARELPAGPGDRVLVLRGSLADDELPRRLAARGVAVEEAVAYRTVEAPPASVALLRSALAGPPIDAVILASGSAARGLLALAGAEGRGAVLATPAICIGPETAREARDLGYRVLGTASLRSSESLARLAERLLRAARQGSGPRGPARTGAVA